MMDNDDQLIQGFGIGYALLNDKARVFISCRCPCLNSDRFNVSM